jgi:hypothetical protein
LYQRTGRPETLFGHIYGETEGHLVTFTGQQARLTNPDAPHNQLAGIRQESFTYSQQASHAAGHLLAESARRRDAYVAVHLFREPGNRLAVNAAPTVRSLWLDEDEGHYPETGPQPTAIVASSAERRHLYWRLTQAVSVEWAVAMNLRVAVWAGGDVGKAGLATVLRAPGTTNYKRHPQVDPVTVEFTGVEEWEPEIMEQALPELPAPEVRHQPSYSAYDGPRIELLTYLEATGSAVGPEVPDQGGTKFPIACPWVAEHTGGDESGTYVGQFADGALWFHCHHEHCQGRGWTEFRSVLRQKREITVETPTPTDLHKRKVVIRLD